MQAVLFFLMFITYSIVASEHKKPVKNDMYVVLFDACDNLNTTMCIFPAQYCAHHGMLNSQSLKLDAVGSPALPLKVTRGQSVVVTPSDGEKTVQSLDQNKEYKFNKHRKQWEPRNTLFQSFLSISIAFTAGIVISFMMRSASK